MPGISGCSSTEPVSVITLLTDFGLKDPYVGIMKGVILSVNPQALIVDVTHEVEPQDVREGAFLIDESYSFFPPGTIHVVVVDPAVGSGRRPMGLKKDGHFFVGPDNGLFTLLLSGDAEARVIEKRELFAAAVSPTFHGRDVFAPVAAHLSKGLSFSALGPLLDDPVRLTDLAPGREGEHLVGEVVRFDRFGNGITNIAAQVFREFVGDRSFVVETGGLVFRALNSSYYEAEYTCLVGSGGYLEIGLFCGDLKNTRGLQKGDRVTVTVPAP